MSILFIFGDFDWKVLQNMIETLGTYKIDDSIFDQNPHHVSNYGVLANFVMEQNEVYRTFSKLHTAVFQIAKNMSEHKASYDESCHQAVYNCVKSFMKASQTAKTTPAVNPRVIKHQLKPKVVKKEDYDLKLVSRKMARDFINYCKAFMKNVTLDRAGLGFHAEALPSLDILE